MIDMLHYMSTLKRCCKQLWKEPQTVFMGSLLCLLLGLPLITFGISCVAGAYYMLYKEQGIEVRFGDAIAAVKPCLGKALLLGIGDILCLIACLNSIARLAANGNFLFKLLHVVFLYVTLLYLSTMLFRYPMLAHNPALPLSRILLVGMGCVLGNTGYVFLYWCVALLLLLVSAGTGIGMVLLLPGGFSLLMAVAWNETKQAMQEKDGGA